MPFDAKDCVSTLVTVDWIKYIYFCVNEFEVVVNDTILFGNEQQKVYFEFYGKAYSRDPIKIGL